jgi:hypothetical protein
LKNTTFNNFQIYEHVTNVCFKNKLITTKKEYDLIFLNYYNNKLEINFTESVKNMGIEYDRNLELILDVVLKKNNETSTGYLILTSTSRIFIITIYD